MIHATHAATLRLLLVMSLVMVTLANLPWTPTARAAQFSVPDGDVDALIAAINTANLTAGPDDIVLADGSTYLLTAANTGSNGLPVITTEITILGNGATITREESAPAFRILEVASSGTLNLVATTISNGELEDHESSYGGGVFNNGGTLNVSNSTFDSNISTYGGGIGALLGTTTVDASTLSNNDAYGEGGGISSDATTLTITNSTINANRGGNGGGIMIRGGVAQLTNLTIDGNRASFLGGGLGVQANLVNAGPNGLTVVNSTIARNHSDFIGGGSSSIPEDVYRPMLINTIVAQNTARNDANINGGYKDGGNNLIGGNAGLGPLADNGGPTKTIELYYDSPAIDAGNNDTAPATDQRGIARPVNGVADIGAYELSDPTPPVVIPNVIGTLGENAWYVSDVEVTWTVTDEETTAFVTGGCGDTTVTTDTSGITLGCNAISGGGTTSVSTSFKRDATPPVITHTGNLERYGPFDTVAITCSASDETSGLASDTCEDITGPVSEFGLGQHDISASATDNAGNVGYGTASFVVAATHDELCTLTRQYMSRESVANSACAMLAIAEGAGPSLVADVALSNYRAMVLSEVSRRYLSAVDGQELIDWSRTL